MQKFTKIQKKWPCGHTASCPDLRNGCFDYSNDLSKRKKISADKIATSGILERITHEQWHVYESLRNLTKNINIINLASLLAVLPRMGIYAYEITQSEIAEKMATHFQMAHVPSRNAVSKWENELQKMGLLEIPRHVDWRNSKTKIRVITPKFWDISRRGLPKMSHENPPVTMMTGKSERVEQYNPKDISDKPKAFEIKKRVIETKNVNGEIPAHAKSEIKKFSRPPKNTKSKIKKLSRFENSVMWWMFQARSLPSYRDGVLLFAEFLRINNTDDYCMQLRDKWRDCTDRSRPGLIRELMQYLSKLSITPTESIPPLQPATEILCQTKEQESLRAALFFDCEPPPQWLELVARFKSSGIEQQEIIISELTRKGHL